MITIIAKATIKKDKIEQFINFANELIIESRKEKGCKMYNLYQDIDSKNILTFIEGWQNEEAIKIHNESVHFKDIVPKLRDMQEEDTEVNLYQTVN